MLTDGAMEKLYQSLQGISFHDQMDLCLSSQDPFRFKDFGFTPGPIAPPLNPDLTITSFNGDHQEDCDFSDLVLNYINQVLMEEDEEEKVESFQLSSALEATEKSLYEAIGKEYPPSHTHVLPSFHAAKLNQSSISSTFTLEHDFAGLNSLVSDNLISFNTCSSSSNGPCRVPDLSSPSQSRPSPRTHGKVPDICNDSESIIQFNKGVEVASKFLPNYNPLHFNSVKKSPTNQNPNETEESSRGRKHRHPEDMLMLLSDSEETRSRKQSVVTEETDEKQEVYDMVLLCSEGRNEAALRESLQDGLNKHGQTNQPKGRGKRKGGKKSVVDLSSLLMLCAQAAATNDQLGAHELLKRIRQHSSPKGDGNQRLAHYFADGIEARLAGAGSPIYTFLVTGRTSAADILRAYHLYLATCPFKKLSNFFSNRTIMDAAEKAERVHIIDLGIVFGFQWPCLLERLSKREGGPPKVRMTGIDFPLPGFRPAKRIEETGKRLAAYAERFGVPFEFNAIAKKWENVTMEDLRIEEGEVVVINCMYRFRHVQDEAAMVDCPRNMVLRLIKKINPKVFILGVVNGAFGAPFFTTRFREVLFHYSTMFDMLEAVAPRESEERAIFESKIFGRQAMNVIACEGAERVERPETYKQWQVRNERIGLKMVDLDREIVEKAKERMRSCYHKDFVIDEDGQWMLQGWKGRIVYAISCWKVGP